MGDAFFCPQTPHDANLHPAPSPKNAHHRLRPDRDAPKHHTISFPFPQATLKSECEANVMDFHPAVLFIDTISKSIYKVSISLTRSPRVFYPYFFLFTHIQKVISFCFDEDYYVEVYGNPVYDQNKLSKRYITLFMIETSWIRHSEPYIDYRQWVKCDIQLVYIIIIM